MKRPENTENLIEENKLLKGRVSELESLEEGYRREKDLLLSIFEATSPLTGEAFMRSLMKELATVLKVRYTLIGEVIDNCKNILTLAVWADGEFAPNMVYELEGTPCDNVVNKTMCYYPYDIQKLFPADRTLVEMGVESYIGVPLFDADGNPLGIMAALHDKPIEDVENAKTLFKFFAVRAGVELQRMRAEEELRKYKERLEDLVEERTAELEGVNDELEAFNYSLAHDLSSPLRVIDGFSKMLEKYYSDELGEEGKEFIRTIRGSAQKMGELISALLHLARIGKSEIIKSTVDMTGLVRSLSDELKTMAPGRDIEFRIDELPSAFGEPTLIRQVFFNLMTNAVKFTRHKEKPVIEIGGYCVENENIYYVKDNGVGFDMKHAGKVFGVFKRLHTEKEFEGTGVGLAIVQRIIQRHGGRVWAEGAVNKGATFHFSLPKG